MKIISVVGNRPQFIKLAAFSKAAKKYPEIKNIIVHSGQHYDFELSQIFFQGLKISKPDYNAGVGSGSHAEQTAKIMLKLEKIFLKEKPDLVVVYGDTNTTLAGALTAVKLHIPIAHIEAGCRGFSLDWPEEVNRILTDRISDFLFAPSYFESKNLLKEGINPERIFLVGNIMTDTLVNLKIKSQKSKFYEKFGLSKKHYAVLTIHRARNVDDKGKLTEILGAIKMISQEIPIVFPIHPRTKKMLKIFRIEKLLAEMPNLILIKPVSYLEMINLVKNSKMVLTDSGGIQHETTVLGIPCLTIRETTEWPITFKQGTSLAAGTSKEKIVKESLKVLSGKVKKGKIPKLWDGHTAMRIVKILTNKDIFKNIKNIRNIQT